MPRALITGVTGQDGLYLSELLLAKGYEVFGLVRGQNNPKRDLLEREVPGVKLRHRRPHRPVQPDAGAERPPQPDEVYNLGAISFVAYSWENARLTSEVTGLGVLNMLEATRLYCGDDIVQGPLLPGVVLGDVRQGAAGAADARRPCSGRARRTAWPRSSATT